MTRLVPPAPAWHAEAMRIVLAAVLVALVAATAHAHTVVVPGASEAGGWERYSLLVPNEKQSPTVRVELRLPAGMEIVAVESKPGWKGGYKPFPIGAATVQWEGGRVPHGEFVGFDFLAWNPPAARTVTWVATQWYEDGSSDTWGGEGDEAHASTTVLRPAKAGDAHRPHKH